jgi:hypothetical protein
MEQLWKMEDFPTGNFSNHVTIGIEKIVLLVEMAGMIAVVLSISLVDVKLMTVSSSSHPLTF